MTAKVATRSAVDHAPTPTVQARQAVAVFDSGSGGLVTASCLARIVDELNLDISVVFLGDTAHLPYGTRTQQDVARLSDDIIGRLASFAPVVGIACNTASASWSHLGRVGKDDPDLTVLSVVAVAADLAYSQAAIVPDPETRRRTKVVGVLGTDLTAEIQSHAEQIAFLHRQALSREIGYQLPLVPHTFGPSGLTSDLSPNVIDLDTAPHLALIREDEHAPGGTTRVLVRNWEPPEHLPHDVTVIARDAQHLVGDVDHHHVLDADGNLKVRWRDNVRTYLKETSAFLTRRHASALILGCTHFEYFTREFDHLLPSLAARGGIISPSGALAWQLLSTYRDRTTDTVQPVTLTRQSFAGFSGDTPPRATFRALGFDHITLYETLSP